jgi:hypothetical protein
MTIIDRTLDIDILDVTRHVGFVLACWKVI